MKACNVLEIINKMMENTKLCSLQYVSYEIRNDIYNSIDK